jgi:hypothetical protein
MAKPLVEVIGKIHASKIPKKNIFSNYGVMKLLNWGVEK